MAHADIVSVWRGGRLETELFLTASDISFDFFVALEAPGVDFLRPDGGGQFIGLTDLDELEIVRSLGNDTCEAAEDTMGDDSEDQISADIQASVKPENDVEHNIDDFLADLPDENGHLQNSHEIETDWMLVRDRQGVQRTVHKATIIADLFNSGCDKISKDRLLRVQYRRDYKSEDIDSQYIPEPSFHVIDRSMSVVRLGSLMVLIVLSVTRILRRDGEEATVVNVSELRQESAGIRVTGQVLAMEDGGVHSGSTCWMWNGEYVQIYSKGAPASLPQAVDGLRKGHVVEIPGHLVIPINLGQDPVLCFPIPRSSANSEASIAIVISHNPLNITHSVLTPMSSAA
ncbi:hypothetical protein HGRIS_014866 [Hohenbuehelia grisea]|uniref:Uncharacterized protein n=1 Tax=Hohenbuehelia grisea TaxID=104357 RepID=A0ABR3IR34_9AGAR